MTNIIQKKQANAMPIYIYILRF